MTNLKQLYDDLRHCYGCTLPQACVGCPYNGCKAEILQYLKDLNGNFTDRERELISLGLLRLMHEADRAYGEIDSDAARSAIKAYRDELQTLNIKVLDMWE